MKKLASVIGLLLVFSLMFPAQSSAQIAFMLATQANKKADTALAEITSLKTEIKNLKGQYSKEIEELTRQIKELRKSIEDLNGASRRQITNKSKSTKK